MTTELLFALSSDDPDWPPVGVEGIPTEEIEKGHRILVPPFFVKGLSVGDVICPDVDNVNGLVFDWKHTEKSEHSTLWLFAPDSEQWQEVQRSILAMACNIETFEAYSLHSLDVPPSCSLDEIETTFSVLKNVGEFSVAYPSLRHVVE